MPTDQRYKGLSLNRYVQKSTQKVYQYKRQQIPLNKADKATGTGGKNMDCVRTFD